MKKIKALLVGQENLIFPCIQDLIENGLTLTRFSNDEHSPTRHDITLYISAWCKHAEIPKEPCLYWLLEYCVSRLSSISKTNASGIRHSTKSAVKYTYRENIPFICECENNKFKALCRDSCPIYSQMKSKCAERKNRPQNDEYLSKPINSIQETQALSVKEVYKTQFEEALLFIHTMLEKKTKKKMIVQLLNDQGLKTRTGKFWTYSILQSELKKIKNNQKI
jgi:hypothetical protein